MTTTTPQAIERELLEIALLEDGLPCSDWSRVGCQREATHLVVCPCGSGRAPMCELCVAKLRARAAKRVLGLVRRVLWFSRSCGHTAPISACAIQPI